MADKLKPLTEIQQERLRTKYPKIKFNFDAHRLGVPVPTKLEKETRTKTAKIYSKVQSRVVSSESFINTGLEKGHKEKLAAEIRRTKLKDFIKAEVAKFEKNKILPKEQYIVVKRSLKNKFKMEWPSINQALTELKKEKVNFKENIRGVGGVSALSEEDIIKYKKSYTTKNLTQIAQEITGKSAYNLKTKAVIGQLDRLKRDLLKNKWIDEKDIVSGKTRKKGVYKRTSRDSRYRGYEHQQKRLMDLGPKDYGKYKFIKGANPGQVHPSVLDRELMQFLNLHTVKGALHPNYPRRILPSYEHVQGITPGTILGDSDALRRVNLQSARYNFNIMGAKGKNTLFRDVKNYLRTAVKAKEQGNIAEAENALKVVNEVYDETAKRLPTLAREELPFYKLGGDPGTWEKNLGEGLVKPQTVEKSFSQYFKNTASSATDFELQRIKKIQPNAAKVMELFKTGNVAEAMKIIKSRIPDILPKAKGGKGALFALPFLLASGALLKPGKLQAAEIDQVPGTVVEEAEAEEAEAEETRTTDQSTMKYNSTTGVFDGPDGEPLDHQSKLDWIAENPGTAGFAALPAFMGLGYGLNVAGMKKIGQHLMSWKAVIPAMMIPEKMHQWKQGMEAGEMITDPFNAIWALGIDSEKSLERVAQWYKDLPEHQRSRLMSMKTLKDLGTTQGWKNLPTAFRNAVMSPAAAGTDWAFQKRLKPALTKLAQAAGTPFAKGAMRQGLGTLAKRAAIGIGAAALLPATVAAGLVSAPLTLGLGALSFGYAQIKDYRDGKAIVDAMRAKGKISEEDAEKYMSLIKQGSLPFGLGNRLFGDDEMTIRGQTLNPEQQRGLLAGMEDQIDLFQEGRREVRALDRSEDFDFFSEGGRVGMKWGGGIDRRAFLKWLAGLGAAVAGGASGLFKSAGKQAIQQVAKELPKQFKNVAGMPAWFPRVVQQIKTHGKLIEMADKHYVNGDIYEMMIPTKVPKMEVVAGKETMSGFETVNKKVRLEENPVSGEIEVSWSVDDFDGEMKRQINFKPGESGFQRFGADPEHPGAWEYQRVKVEEPEFTYGNPDQSHPERAEFDYKDIFTEGDDVVKGLEDLTKTKQMIAKDGSIINVADEGKGIDEAFQKKIFKDIEGEGQIIPDAEGHMSSEGWHGEKGNEIIGGEIPEKLYKKARGGTVETGDIARRQSLVPPLSGPDPQGIMGLPYTPKQVRVS